MMQEQLMGSSAGKESKTTSREAIHAVQYSHVMLSRAAVDLNLEPIDAAQENLDAVFDFARQLPEVKSPSIFFEVSAGQVSKQFENLTRHSQQLTGLAQKVESIRSNAG
jgi:hypothetical protein